MRRRALSKLGIVIDIVSFHKCAETPILFSADALEAVPIEGNNKWVLSLNALDISKVNQQPPTLEPKTSKRFSGVGTNDLEDRRFSTDKPAKSTAPNSIAEQIRLMSNSIPSKDLHEISNGKKDEDDSAEMGD